MTTSEIVIEFIGMALKLIGAFQVGVWLAGISSRKPARQHDSRPYMGEIDRDER